jgi:hypothetical protein
MAYVGVDLHRKRSHVVALDPTGEVVLSRRIGNAPGPPAGHQAISAARVTNDAVDAKTLAHLLKDPLLRTNLLAEAWIARRLVRTRAALVRMRSRVQSQLDALMAGFAIYLATRPTWPSSSRP